VGVAVRVRDWTVVKCCGRLFYKMLPENTAEFYQAKLRGPWLPGTQSLLGRTFNRSASAYM
jgi:hypothetical protein